jgi:hypothetical protein
MHCLVCKLVNDSFSFSNPEFDVKMLQKLAQDREQKEIIWVDDDEKIIGYIFEEEEKEEAYHLYK